MHAHRHLYHCQVKSVSGLHMVWCINVGIKLLLNRHVVYIYVYVSFVFPIHFTWNAFPHRVVAFVCNIRALLCGNCDTLALEPS